MVQEQRYPDREEESTSSVGEGGGKWPAEALDLVFWELYFMRSCGSVLRWAMTLEKFKKLIESKVK